MTLKDKTLAMQRLNAFRVFLIYSIEKAKKMYREQVDFILSNQHKTFSEVEHDLLNTNKKEKES